MTIIYSDLKGKVVFISGIGQVPQSQDDQIWGNGAATARTLAQSGAIIYGCDLDLEAAELTQHRVRADLPSAIIDVVQADATNHEDVKQAIRGCMSQHGRIDVLVCNVGKSAPGGPVEMSEETWHNQLDVNLTSAFLCCKEVLPIMEKQSSGSVILLSSIAGQGYMGRSHIGYSTTKAALVNFAKTMGVRYAAQNVRVNVVIPGLINTPLVARLAHEYNNGDYAGTVASRAASVPQRRMGTAFDVANTIAFLSSEEASGYVTATSIIVDGGLCSSLIRED